MSGRQKPSQEEHFPTPAGLPVGEEDGVAAEHLPVLILAPLQNDARLTAEFLATAGLNAQVCASARQLTDLARKWH